MTKRMLSTRLRMDEWLRERLGDRQAGQGTLEYVGMIIVAAIIVVAVLQVTEAIDLGKIFKGEVSRVTDFSGG